MLTPKLKYYTFCVFIFFSLTSVVSLHAQQAPVCTETDVPANAEPADEYYKAMQRACAGINAGVWDSARYYLEKAIFFKGFVSVPQEKRKQLFQYLGKEKFIKLPCFCENPGDVADMDSLIPFIQPMIEGNSSDIVLDAATKKDLEYKAVIKCNQFVEYIKVVTGENNNRDVISNAIESAVALFVNEDCKIEVSSKSKSQKTKLTVRKYFQKLNALHQSYDKIYITGSGYYIVSGLRKGPDGNYYTVVSFEQVFTGYHKDQIAYADLTRKNIVVMVMQLKKVQEGALKSVWDILLKEVQVVETI